MEVSSSTSKRQRTDFDDRNDEDSINRLPDALLCQVLSFLPITYAVQTSVLARRWRYLWASMPNLCFDNSFHAGPCGTRFEAFVDKALILRRLCIKKFGLKCVGYEYDASQVNVWIRVAILLNVEELDLHVDEILVRDVYLPMNLFIHEKLSVLKLHGQIRLPSFESMFLPNMKVCHFKSLRLLTNDCIEMMVSRCPILEELVIHMFNYQEDIQDLKIVSFSLRRLSIHVAPIHDPTIGRTTLVIDTPNLEFLDLEDYGSDEFEVSAFPLLVKATIDVKQLRQSMSTSYEYGQMVNQLLRQVFKVKDLCISNYVTTALTLGLNVDLPSFYNLNRLEIKGDVIMLSTLLSILKCLPAIEVISLGELFHVGRVDGMLFPERCLSSLRIIEFREFSVYRTEMEMIEHILKNAKLLKKMMLRVNKFHRPDSDELIHIMQEILMFTRASKECQVVFLP